MPKIKSAKRNIEDTDYDPNIETDHSEQETSKKKKKFNKSPKLNLESDISDFLAIKNQYELSDIFDDLTFAELSEEEGSDWTTKFLNDLSKFLNKKQSLHVKLRTKVFDNPSEESITWMREVFKKSLTNLQFRISDNENRFYPY